MDSLVAQILGCHYQAMSSIHWVPLFYALAQKCIGTLKYYFGTFLYNESRLGGITLEEIGTIPIQ